jgi:orotidine-5'-phosphate decarboxylase
MSRAVPIVALDVPTMDRALALADDLGPLCRFYKVGSELFVSTGPAVVAALRERGCDVFLDVKLHDIPNTVRSAARSAARLGVTLLTVHASGGEAMVRAAVEGAGEECGILAVTVLTSLDESALAESWGRPPLRVLDEVVRLAELARRAGAHGVVCSGGEVAALRSRHGDALRILVPGLRPQGASTDDQSRIATPAAAARDGASYLVLGRAVTASVNPRGALEAILATLAD